MRWKSTTFTSSSPSREATMFSAEVAVRDARGVAAEMSQICAAMWRCARARGPRAGDLLEVAAVEELQHHEDRPVGEAAHVGHLDDVAVVDGRRRHRLAAKAPHDVGPRGEVGVEALDRDAAADELVLGLVDLAHPAFAEDAHDAIPLREQGADARIHSRRVEAERRQPPAKLTVA
ncbi:MAG: hypothetical protein U0326_40770 [Polyangiales bacterium]